MAYRRLALSGRADWGYGLSRAAFLRHAGAGFALGLATMLPMTLVMLALGILGPRPGTGVAAVLAAFAVGSLMGLAVAFVEETFFRGLMYRAVSRESGHWTAAWLTALVYAAIHFFARVKIPAEGGCSCGAVRYRLRRSGRLEASSAWRRSGQAPAAQGRD